MINSISFNMDDDLTVIIEDQRVVFLEQNDDVFPSLDIRDLEFISNVAVNAYENGVMPEYCCEECRRKAEEENLLINGTDDSIVN